MVRKSIFGKFPVMEQLNVLLYQNRKKVSQPPRNK